MSTLMCEDVLLHFQRTLNMYETTIKSFDDTQWLQGLSFFQVPAKVAFHALDCLDFYFRDTGDGRYKWGYRFGGGWWELSDADQPSRADLLDYIGELRLMIIKRFKAMTDDDLLKLHHTNENGETLLAHLIYAIRHTMHHHGALTLLAIHHGIERGAWE